MKKARRIIAIIGVIVLLGLYAAAFIFALIDDPDSMNYFLAAIVATVIIPVLLWTMQFVYEILNKYYRPKSPEETSSPATETPAESGGPSSDMPPVQKDSGEPPV